ncbi:MAG TPA: DEAD/DEAH box helicase, partial [Chloroflexota bacterium]|nr:DEAD/DEAH box helicase [Chloroflexota bacterium]
MKRGNRAALNLFSPTARAWFQGSFGAPTEIQESGWPEIAAGRHALLCAPTGSGKTLAAFFWCLDRLLGEPVPGALKRCRVLYVSPLKALAFDVDRNLRSPLAGLALEARRHSSSSSSLDPAMMDSDADILAQPRPASDPTQATAITVGVRTGDTSAADRRDMQRHPPDILITTPESLFLLLTSASRSILQSVRWVVVDEIHTMAATKRGAHLAVSLERLCRRTESEPQRIGLSATQKPLEEVARYLGGRGREVSIVDAGLRKTLDLSVEVPAQDMARLDLDSSPGSAGAPPRGGTSAQVDVGITTAVARARGWATPDGDGAATVIAPDQDRRLPAHSIWPSIYPRILELIRSHHSTIVFVNSRRMAERLAAKLNELAEEELVLAHHGSIAREQRLVVEERLKAGTLPALVATSSLELGIDMGAVDLVIQVSSPTSVSRGIQRIGRAGHSVGEPSTGTILPTHRGDLLECATIVERMLAGEIETTRVPRNPLDVLAQQIVAMTALDSWQVDDLRAAITGAYPFADLGDRAFTATLDMLDGRYPSQEFAGLRARVTWDRVNGSVRGRQGAQRLAVISGGTIPDRGLFTVNLLDDGKRVGELDEEMVYELRAGETFVLGATTWKAVEITQSQVRVVPAPGEPAKISFWHGDALGRPVEVGRAVGALTREVVAATDGEGVVRLIARSRCDLSAAKNLVSFLREQESATGAVPDDRTVVVERFRDQLGDWRVCVLTPYGARIHAPWALAIQAALQEKLGLEIQSIYSDDGFALRLVDADVVPRAEDVLLDPDDVREAVTAQLHGSPLFASRFREN